jgi:hypothetical protein
MVALVHSASLQMWPEQWSVHFFISSHIIVAVFSAIVGLKGKRVSWQSTVMTCSDDSDPL